MNADELLALGTDSAAWFAKSVSLRRSADALWDAFSQAVLKWTPLAKAQSAEATKAWDQANDYLIAAKMLYGLSAETAFKAAIIRDHPADVEFRLVADGSGHIQHVELRQLGVSMGAGHDWVRLADQAGLFRSGKGELSQVDSDYRAIRAILEDLGEVVVWSGRYPIPLRSGQQRPISPDVPGVAFGHYLRDWLDTVLDFYHLALDSLRPDST